ncbi:anti-sigma factor family protein [Ottowia thiooxydans]|uniref:anti-sigma factor family protein n=1 Tax=Ottowia thiooxydans TaxID=219182 RepID=UPI0004914FD0|nr:anti-sigma factor [Ottowia thiooxydans]
MDDNKPRSVSSDISPGVPAPITEADLHAYADQQLSAERTALVELYLATRPQEQERVRDWQKQNRLLRRLLDPVLEEPLPLGLPLKPPANAFPWRSLAACGLIAIVSGFSAWSLRGHLDAETVRLALAGRSDTASITTAGGGALSGFAHRAAIAHVVYSPDARRPVEVGADQEQALVTWLTKRMGTSVHPPTLSKLGYDLIGGRLLPGDKGPVAQFMYGTPGGQRLTLYVTREVPGDETSAFRFGTDGPVNVFYWVENQFGYAISAGADRAELMRVSQEVYAQLKPR